jgi:signal transduction histidine kinase/ligand-binding sensor domain-containing protein
MQAGGGPDGRAARRGGWRALALAAVLVPAVDAAAAPALPPALAPAAAIDAPALETIGDARAVPNGIVTHLVEDADGLLWLGTTDGLVRFDGYRFARVRAEGLPAAFVRQLHPARDGGLWIALQGHGLVRRDPRSGRFAPVPAEAGGRREALGLAEDAQGGLWVADALDGLHWLPPAGSGAAARHLLEGRGMRTVMLDADGRLWAGGRGGLWTLAPGEAQPTQVAGFEDDYVYALYRASDGRLWIGTQARGAAVLEPDGTLRRLPLAPAADGVGHPWVDGFAERRPGELWMATFGGGIEVRALPEGRLLRRLRHVPGEPGGLALDRVPGVLRDRAGHLWIPTWGAGLQRLPAGAEAVAPLRARPGVAGALAGPTVMSSLPRPDGTLWVGLAGQGIDVVDPDRRRVIQRLPAEALGDGTVRALAEGREGQVWVGTQQAGLLRWRGPALGFEALSAGWPERRVRRLAAAVEGGVWVGLEAGLLRVDDEGRAWHGPERDDGGAREEPVWAVLDAPDLGLLVGTPSQLLHRPPGASRLQALALPEAGPSAGVLDLLRARDGRLWVLAQGGLHVGTPGPGGLAMRRVLAAEDVPEGIGQQLLEDAAGVLWTGRIRVEPGTGRWQALGLADGIDVGNQVWAAGSRLADGRLLLGGTDGLLLLDPARFEPWTFAPRVVATAVEVDGRAVALDAGGGGLRLAPGRHRLAVEFAALDYADPAALRYRYRLLGQDPAWVEGDASQRIAAYGNLWPGDYVLEVQGSNRAGDWSPHLLRIPIQVAPAFWQTPWAIGLAALALLALVLLAGRWRARREQARADRLEALVEARAAELRAAQQQLVEREKLASLGQLVAGVAHELNTPLGNALMVSSSLADDSAGLQRALAEGALRRSELERWVASVVDASQLLSRSVGRAHELVAGFKQVAADQSSDQRRRYDLAQVVRETLEILAPGLRRTACRVELDLPEGLAMDGFPGALSQLVANIANNAALHAFPERGVGEGLLRIEARVEGEGVRLVFRDDGIGMDEATRRRAFEPFFTTRLGNGGTGLGLSIVHTLVYRGLGGRLALESAPGQGATLTAWLPRVAPAHADA